MTESEVIVTFGLFILAGLDMGYTLYLVAKRSHKENKND